MQKYKTVDEFLKGISDSKKFQVLKLRECILSVEPTLKEHIKWNAPSYVHDGVDRITFNVFNKEGLVKLVFHMGAVRKENKIGKPVLNDEFSIIEWASDIRGYITFKDLDDVLAKEEAVEQLTSKWLAIH